MTLQDTISPVRRILVVEDDHAMQQMLADYLKRNEMDVEIASDGRSLAKLLTGDSFSLVILDLKLGQEDGFELLRTLRAHSDMPVIIITGHKVDEIDRVVGLELGADDYITKPFSPRELLARIRVVLRRMEAARIESAKTQGRATEHKVSRFGPWKLDRHRRRLSTVGGADITLTKSEYTLLLAFLDAPMRPLSREYLIGVTRMHEDVYDRSIDVQILRLRRKLESDASAPRVIQTERGLGYVFALAVMHDKM